MAVEAFLKIDGIDGESPASGHEDEIDVLSWSWGAHQSGTMHHGRGGGTGKVSVQDLAVTKWVDKATPNLWKYCCNGQHKGEAVLTVRKAGGDAPVEYLKITMEDVLISNVQTSSGTGEERMTETVSLNFAKFKMEYTPQEDDGTAGATLEAGWDIRANQEA